LSGLEVHIIFSVFHFGFDRKFEKEKSNSKNKNTHATQWLNKKAYMLDAF